MEYLTEITAIFKKHGLTIDQKGCDKNDIISSYECFENMECRECESYVYGVYYQFLGKNDKHKIFIFNQYCFETERMMLLFYKNVINFDNSNSLDVLGEKMFMKHKLKNPNPISSNVIGQALNNLGLYYETETDNYDEAVAYYLSAIEKGNVMAMFNLGDYYYHSHNTDKMKKYFEMAIEKGNVKAMTSLAYYYNIVDDLGRKQHHRIISLYEGAIEKGSVKAMHKLGTYYENRKYYKKMAVCYEMVLENGWTLPYHAMIELGDHYNRIKDYERSASYYKMTIDSLPFISRLKKNEK